MPNYIFKTGKDYNQTHNFSIKPLKFKLMDETIPILQKINDITNIDYSKYEGVTQTPGNDADLGKYLELVQIAKEVPSREDFRKLFDLQVELFKKTILFDEKTNKYKEQILENADFWEEQDIKELNKNLQIFRTYIK